MTKLLNSNCNSKIDVFQRFLKQKYPQADIALFRFQRATLYEKIQYSVYVETFYIRWCNHLMFLFIIPLPIFKQANYLF